VWRLYLPNNIDRRRNRAALPAAKRRRQAFRRLRRNAQTALSAAPLELKLTVDGRFRGVDFFETDEGGLPVRG
jgi:hypothetical protein